MSLYNLVNGHSVGCLLVMPMLGRKPDEYPRFRDCFFGKADDGTREIHIFTRVGSLNQNYGMGEEALYKLPGYIRFEDCDEDRTYGTYIFKCPEKWESDFDAIVARKLSALSEDYFAMQRRFWDDAGERAVAQIKAAIAKYENKPLVLADILAEMRNGPTPKHRIDTELTAHYADLIQEAIKGEAAALERIVRDAVIDYSEQYVNAPNDDVERELKERASKANAWLVAHGFKEEPVIWSKEEAPCL